MALADILRSGIAIADGVTKGVQVDITHEAFIGADYTGAETYASPVTLKAIVDMTRRQRTTSTGRLVTVVATVTILQSVTANGATVNPPRQEPIDPRDKITLPNGVTGPIIDDPDSVLDPSTNKPFLNQIIIGIHRVQ